MYWAIFLSLLITLVSGNETFWPDEHNKEKKPVGPPKICGSPSDIVFIMDGSSSIWGPDFEKQLEFIETVVNEFPIKDDGSMTRIGVLQFSSDNKIKVEFNLGNHFKSSTLMVKIANIKQLRGNTYTNLAIKKARQQMFTRRAGCRWGDKTIPKIAIIMTDGVSEYPSETAKEARQLQQMGVRMLSIGIGHGTIDKEEIYTLASEPKKKNAFFVASFSALNNIKKDLAIQACQVKAKPQPWSKCGVNKKTDVAFVLGGSTTSSSLESKRAFWFIKKVVSKFEVSPNKIQVAVVPKECEAPGFHFNKYSTKQQIYKHMSNAKITLQTTTERMTYMAKETFKSRNGARPGVRKLAVLVVRPGEDSTAARLAADKAKTRGIEVAVIGVGVPAKKLRGIASQGKLITIPNYKTIPLKMKKMMYSVICQSTDENEF